jgi:threonine/homoserine/homoserine lactone efflux protein
MAFLPAADILFVFTLASVVLILTPGPDMTYFLGQTLSAGRARGFTAMFGAVAGVLIHSLLAAFGLSALLAASAQAFMLLKIAGAVYLLWLAIQALRHGSALRLGREAAPHRPLLRVFFAGAGVNLLNPKIVMFFLTFLPQFIAASDPEASGKLLFLGLLFALLSLPLCSVVILAADRFTGALRRSPRIMRVVDWLFAGLMSAFAVRLLFARNP